ncbi:MAG: hypothetical protein U1E15_06040 [Hyphomicrobiales bacterium]
MVAMGRCSISLPYHVTCKMQIANNEKALMFSSELEEDWIMIVVWRITTNCNLHCPFCAYDSSLAMARKTVSEAEMAGFVRILADYQQSTRDKVLVSWLGGEPLATRRLHGINCLASSLGLGVRRHDKWLHAGQRHLRSHLVSEYAELTISIDGAASFHDGMRGWLVPSPSFRNGFHSLRNRQGRKQRPCYCAPTSC